NEDIIHVNANPDSTDATPYIDGYQNTNFNNGPYGNKYDLTFRLGNLKDLPSSVIPSGMPNPSGTGLFTTNIYAKGHIVATSGEVGDFSISNMIGANASSGNGSIEIAPDSANLTGAAYANNTPLGGIPTIGMWNSSDGSTQNRAIALMGETMDNGWTGAMGFSFAPSKNGNAWFRVDRDVSNGDLTAKLAGFNFNATEFQSTNNTGFKTSGIYMDSAAEQFSLGDNIWF